MRAGRNGLVAGVAAGLLMLRFAGPAGAGDPPGFIVVLTDDQGWSGTSLRMDPDLPDSASDYYRTPALEALAARGMRFTDGYAPAPFCCPTRRGLLTGQAPARHVYRRDQPGWAEEFRRQWTIPRMLRALGAGYRTAHLGKWDHRFDGVTPEEMGYHVSDGPTGNATGGAKGTGGPAARKDPKLLDSLVARARRFLGECRDAGRPFYLQVSHYAVHLDIFYREESLAAARSRPPGRRHTMAEFAAMTADLDAALGEIIAEVNRLGLAGNTYVFYLSDNGGRKSLPGAPPARTPLNHPLRDGKGSMYEGGLRVPFVVAGPGVEPGGVCRVPVTGLDLLPTIADLAGHRSELPPTLDGGSLRPLLEGGGRSAVERARPGLIFHQAVSRKAQSALRDGRFKVVRTWAEDRVELFDLVADPGETRDLAADMPARCRELDGRLRAYLTEVGAETRRTLGKEALGRLFERSGR